MSNQSTDHNPPFNRFEQKLRTLANALFSLCYFLWILPFLCWTGLPSKLAITWDNFGQPIDWVSKEHALVSTAVILALLGLLHYFLWVQTHKYVYFDQRGGPPRPYTEKRYRRGRVWVLIVMSEIYTLSIYWALCSFNGYMFSASTPFQSLVSLGSGIMAALSSLALIIISIDSIK